MGKNKIDLTEYIKRGEELSFSKRVRLVLMLSIRLLWHRSVRSLCNILMQLWLEGLVQTVLLQLDWFQQPVGCLEVLPML